MSARVASLTLAVIVSCACACSSAQSSATPESTASALSAESAIFALKTVRGITTVLATPRGPVLREVDHDGRFATRDLPLAEACHPTVAAAHEEVCRAMGMLGAIDARLDLPANAEPSLGRE